MRFLIGMLLAALGWVGTGARAQDVLPVPVLVNRIIDQTGTLNTMQRSALEAKLATFEAAAGPQMVVLIVPTVQPEDIASYAQRVADSWKIGRREVGDGLVIVVAKNDRKVRIEVAKALEGAVPDLAARQIIQNAITPAFKQGDYAGGLNLAVDQLQARVRGEGLPAPQARHSGNGDGFDWETLAALFFIGVPILASILTAIFGRKLGSLATAGVAGGGGYLVSGFSWWIGGLAGFAALLMVGVFGIGAARRSAGLGNRYSGRGSGLGNMPVIWGGGGSFDSGGSSSDSSSSSDSFSSGGGGDFGGGGASGDW